MSYRLPLTAAPLSATGELLALGVVIPPTPAGVALRLRTALVKGAVVTPPPGNLASCS